MKNKSFWIKILVSSAIVIIVILTTFFLNYSVINNLVIGNEEVYDTDNLKTGYLFNLFYEISSNTGYHPEPSYFNFIFTTIIGIVIGGFFTYIFIWRQKKEARTHNNGLA